MKERNGSYECRLRKKKDERHDRLYKCRLSRKAKRKNVMDRIGAFSVKTKQET